VDATGLAIPKSTGAPRVTTQDHMREEFLVNMPKIDAAIAKKQEAEAGAAYVTGIISGKIPFNPYDDKARKVIDETFQATDLPQRVYSGDYDALANAVHLTGVVGYTPKPVVESLQGLADSNDPKKQVIAYTAVANIIDNHPQAFAQYDGAKKMLQEADIYRDAVESGLTPDQAIAKITALNNPDHKKLVKGSEKEADAFLKTLTSSTIAHLFDTSLLPFNDPALDIKTAQGRLAVLEFQELAKDAFDTYGDTDIATKIAGAQFKRSYGVSTINGQKEVMLYPPEYFYPEVGGSRDYIRSQAEEVALKSAPGIDPKTVRLVADRTSRHNLARLGVASYQLQYVNKYGLPEVILGPDGDARHWVPDVNKAKADMGTKFNEEHAKEMERQKERLKDHWGVKSSTWPKG
jgi:hypothetical protein